MDAMASSAVPELHVAASGAERVTVPAWEREGGWLWHGFSTRRGGVSRAYLADAEKLEGELNLGFTLADEAENVRENRSRLVEAVTGSRETPLVTVRQVHSNRSVVVRRPELLPGVTPEADGLMTSESGILLGILTADCVPVLVADRERRVVAAFHAGWRGTVQRIVELGVARMQEEFGLGRGSGPGALMAAIGPGIGSCCYAVGDEVRAEFGRQFSYAAELLTETAAEDGGQPGLQLDLMEANRRQLLDAGLTPESIELVGGCTACQPELFFSHRATRGRAGRMMAVIGIR